MLGHVGQKLLVTFLVFLKISKDLKEEGERENTLSLFVLSLVRKKESGRFVYILIFRVSAVLVRSAPETYQKGCVLMKLSPLLETRLILQLNRLV